ncbi:MAG: hypothetical protein ACJAXJ_004547, partial [Colwellia sp.]
FSKLSSETASSAAYDGALPSAKLTASAKVVVLKCDDM